MVGVVKRTGSGGRHLQAELFGDSHRRGFSITGDHDDLHACAVEGTDGVGDTISGRIHHRFETDKHEVTGLIVTFCRKSVRHGDDSQAAFGNLHSSVQNDFLGSGVEGGSRGVGDVVVSTSSNDLFNGAFEVDRVGRVV